MGGNVEEIKLSSKSQGTFGSFKNAVAAMGTVNVNDFKKDKNFKKLATLYNERIDTLYKKDFQELLEKALANVDAMEESTKDTGNEGTNYKTYRQHLFKAIKDWQEKKSEIKSWEAGLTSKVDKTKAEINKKISEEKGKNKKANLEKFKKEIESAGESAEKFSKYAKKQMKEMGNEIKEQGKASAKSNKDFGKKLAIVTRKTLNNALIGKNSTGVLGSLQGAKNILDNYKKRILKKVENEKVKKAYYALENAGAKKGYINSKTTIYAAANMGVQVFDNQAPKIVNFNCIKQTAKAIYNAYIGQTKDHKWNNPEEIQPFSEKFLNSKQTDIDNLCKTCIFNGSHLDKENLELAKGMVSNLLGLCVFNNFDPAAIAKLVKSSSKKIAPSGGRGSLITADYDEIFSGGGYSLGCRIGHGIAVPCLLLLRVLNWIPSLVVGVVAVLAVAFTWDSDSLNAVIEPWDMLVAAKIRDRTARSKNIALHDTDTYYL